MLKSTISKIVILTVLLLFATSCAQRKLVRTHSPLVPAGEPVIDLLVDLGGRPLPETGSIPTDRSDGQFFAGEWIAVVGSHLSSVSTIVKIDGHPVRIEGHIENGSIIIRQPPGLGTEDLHTLKVETPLGGASIQLRTSLHLVAGDPRADKLLVYRSLANEKQLFDSSPTEFEIPRAGRFTVTPDHSTLYALSPAPEGGRNIYRIRVIDLCAPGQPVKIGHLDFEADYPPSDIAFTGDEKHLAVLTGTQLFTFTLSPEMIPVPAGSWSSDTHNDSASKPAGESGYTRMVSPKNRASLIIMNPEANDLTLIDVSDPNAPAAISTYAAAPPGALPSTLEILIDPAAPDTVLLLMGPGPNTVFKSIDEAGNKLRAMTGEDSTDTAAQSDEGGESIEEKLLQLKLSENGFSLVRQTMLPDGFIPIGMINDIPTGSVLINGFGMDVSRFAELKPEPGSVGRLTRLLSGSAKMGKLIHVDRQGNIKENLSAVSIYLDIARTPKGGDLVYSVLKPSVRMIPPSVGVELSIDVKDRQNMKLRRLKWTALLPPWLITNLEIY